MNWQLSGSTTACPGEFAVQSPRRGSAVQNGGTGKEPVYEQPRSKAAKAAIADISEAAVLAELVLS